VSAAVAIVSGLVGLGVLLVAVVVFAQWVLDIMDDDE